MKVERLISWFDIKTEELKGEVNIDNVDFPLLKSIFNPTEEDPLMYNPYTVSAKEANQLKSIVDIQFDLNTYIYQIDCFQI